MCNSTWSLALIRQNCVDAHLFEFGSHHCYQGKERLLKLDPQSFMVDSSQGGFPTIVQGF